MCEIAQVQLQFKGAWSRVVSPAQTDEAAKLAAAWVTDEQLESALPNPPTITSGKVIAFENPVPVA